jgi:methylmalonyl-CoA mutase
LTQDLADRALEHITEIEELGGMAKPLKPAFQKCGSKKRRPKPRHASIAGQQSIIGVNYKPERRAATGHPEGG